MMTKSDINEVISLLPFEDKIGFSGGAIPDFISAFDYQFRAVHNAIL